MTNTATITTPTATCDKGHLHVSWYAAAVCERGMEQRAVALLTDAEARTLAAMSYRSASTGRTVTIPED